MLELSAVIIVLAIIATLALDITRPVFNARRRAPKTDAPAHAPH
jgi:hypothetical protein